MALVELGYLPISFSIIQSHTGIVLCGRQNLSIQVGELDLIDAGIVSAQLRDLRDVVGGGSCFGSLVYQVRDRVETDGAPFIGGCQDGVGKIEGYGGGWYGLRLGLRVD